MIALAATGCATRGSVHRLQNDLGALRVEVTELRQSQERIAGAQGRTATENRALAARLAEVNAALQGLATDLARLRERVDAAEAQAREAKALAAPAPTPPSSAAIPPAVEPPPRLRQPVTAAPSDPANRPMPPEQAYRAALATFRAREHGQAVLDFLDFIAKHPGHPLVANAQYWIGEAYYAQRDYRQAQTEFQKVLQVAPTSPKAADALLKIGYCQLNLRDAPRARQTWQRVVREFPKSEAATKARALLTARGGPGPR